MIPAQRAAPPFVVALLLLAAIAYLPALGGGFLFDDFSNIVHKEDVHAQSLDADSLAKAATAYGGLLGRPLATMSLAANHAFGGLEPRGYKLVNLLLHLLNAALVFALARRLLARASGGTPATTLAAFALALAWAIHPLQVSTVMYVVQRMEMMSLTFVLLGLLAYLEGRRRQIAGERGAPWLAGSLLLAGGGLLAKETALLFPAYTLALELTVLGFAAATPAATRQWKAAYGAATAAAILAFLIWVLPLYLSPEAYAMRDYGPGERVLTQLRVLVMYLHWMLVPQPTSYVFYYDNLQASQGLLDPASTLAGGLLLTALAAIAWATRRRIPLLSLGLLWFFASHLLSSNVVPLELAFEHRNYFALFGVLLAVAALVLRLPATRLVWLRPATVAVVLAGLMLLTLIRSATWGDPYQLAMSMATHNPESARASMDFGEQLMLRANRDPNSRYYQMAMDEFERGSRVPNASPMPEQGLIVLAATAGQPAKDAWWDRIVHKLETRAIGPQEQGMVSGLLRMRHQGIAIDDARFAEAYQVLIDRLEMPPEQYYAFADHALTMLGDEAVALPIYKVAIDHGDAEFAASVVDALYGAGYVAIARSLADHARSTGRADILLPEAPAAEPAGTEEPSP